MTLEPGCLFTYGTLMRGFDNPFAEKLQTFSTYEGKGHFNGRLYQITWYPGAIYDSSGQLKVHGEIFRLCSQEILKELDEYEDVMEDETASLYVRKIIPVITETGSELACWAYLYNQPVHEFPLIESGHFMG